MRSTLTFPIVIFIRFLSLTPRLTQLLQPEWEADRECAALTQDALDGDFATVLIHDLPGNDGLLAEDLVLGEKFLSLNNFLRCDLNIRLSCAFF